MTVSVEFEPTEGGMALSKAILLYQSSSRGRVNGDGPAFASIHPVEQQPGGPVIGAGAPLTRAHLRRWSQALGRSAPPEILPANVLVAHPDVLAWWVPEQVRPAYFDITRPTPDLKVLGQRTTVPVPYPAHLLIATRKTVYVVALPKSERPCADTPVLHSPVLNVFITGALCWGNIAKPKGLTVAAIAEYERAVFDSWSTHPNAGQDRSITGKGGLVRLWDGLAARWAKRFPVSRLKPFEGLTVGQLIQKVSA
ncbi:PRTRC system protein B [Novosphingobium piscinae]|uniref:PRTRC system protein B n=1 Tax=Novosphingobium piscinae TaxID=1507448 RepID=A0A7X1KPG5_9SPHN|nr:PRTRC system protein B [Novosphingobium piscinae]MBC2668741.1 PRTRC system protein B [Novosphingobium piscinae]